MHAQNVCLRLETCYLLPSVISSEACVIPSTADKTAGGGYILFRNKQDYQI